jgi:hypothetical protein
VIEFEVVLLQRHGIRANPSLRLQDGSAGGPGDEEEGFEGGVYISAAGSCKCLLCYAPDCANCHEDLLYLHPTYAALYCLSATAMLTSGSTALFPKLLEFYRNLEAPTSSSSAQESPTILAHILTYLNAYKASFARPIDSRYDIVLLGGALGSLFS